MRTLIQDEFTHLPVSRQRKHQLRKTRDRECLFCGEPAVMQYYCLKHMERQRERARKQLGLRRRNSNALRYRIAEAQANPPRRPSDCLPAKLSFSLFLGEGACHKLEFKSKRLTYRSGQAGVFTTKARVVPVHPLNWQVFWMALDHSKVWDWQSFYKGELAKPIRWQLTVQYKGRKVTSRGKNGFPGGSAVTTSPARFSPVLVAFRQLTRIKEIRLKG